MQDIIKITDATGNLLAYKIPADTRAGLAAYSADSDFIQALSWRYDKGTRLQAHVHHVVPRTAMRTQEAIIVVKGTVRADVFDEDRALVDSVMVGSGECMVFLAGGHGYEVLEPDTQVFEIKNGPFLGVETDKAKF